MNKPTFSIDEPKIIVNGTLLTTGQAMTVRVAIQSFASDLVENGLGEDEHGISMTKNYLDRIKEINTLFIEA
jgi:hypothetical protein